MAEHQDNSRKCELYLYTTIRPSGGVTSCLRFPTPEKLAFRRLGTSPICFLSVSFPYEETFFPPGIQELLLIFFKFFVCSSFSPTCVMKDVNDFHCDACITGYEGQYCER